MSSKELSKSDKVLEYRCLQRDHYSSICIYTNTCWQLAFCICSTSEAGEFLHHRDRISRMSKLNLTEVVWDRRN